jgi:hypothetical protein
VSLKTNPILKSILLNGMTCWLAQIPFNNGGIPNKYHQVIQDHMDIGCYHLFVAWFATQWAALQSQYLQEKRPAVINLSGEKWTASICTVITTMWLTLWDLRNKDRHGADSSLQSQALKEQATCEIKILYTSQDKVLQKDKLIFNKDISLHIDSKTAHICQWINTNQQKLYSKVQTKQKSIFYSMFVLSIHISISAETKIKVIA